MKKIVKLIVLLTFLNGTFTGCKKPTVDPAQDTPSQESNLVSVTHVADVSSGSLQGLAGSFGLGSLKTKLKYDVSVDKIIYKTTYKGRSISASGLVYTPKSSDVAFPVLSVHHGTTFKKSDAPSTSYKLSEQEFAASSGYITVVPDYIGYGASSDIFHPYYDQYHSAQAVIDMISAEKEHALKNEVKLNSNLFLLGYSEGGYVTLATQKALETSSSLGLTLKGVAAGAGGYDLTQMLHSITDNSSYTYPAYLAFVIQSFITTYDWKKPLNYFFADPYGDRLKTYLNGSYSGGQINGQLTTATQSLLNATFYQNVKGSGEEEFKKALLQNSLINWKPETPLRMYHGSSDEVIPYQNSEQVYNSFKQAGCDVTFTLIPNGTHGSSLLPMVQDVIPWFEGLNGK